MSASADPEPSRGQHRAEDTDPVRRWEDNFHWLWMSLQDGSSFGLGYVGVLAASFAVFWSAIMLWPGASIGGSAAAVYAVIATGCLYGLLWVAALAISTLLGLVLAARALVRFLRHR